MSREVQSAVSPQQREGLGKPSMPHQALGRGFRGTWGCRWGAKAVERDLQSLVLDPLPVRGQDPDCLGPSNPRASWKTSHLLAPRFPHLHFF